MKTTVNLAERYRRQNRMAYSEVTSHVDRTHTVTWYAYDALGRRTLTESVTGQTLRTLYDGRSFEVIREGETFRNGLLTTRYAAGGATASGNGVLQSNQPTGERYRWISEDNGRITSDDGYAVEGNRYGGRGVTLYGNGEAVAVSYSSSTGSRSAYLGKDILGSVKTATTDTGALEDRYEYDAFGTVYQGDLGGGMNLGYTGKPYETATGLYNYGYRDYSPQAARFTTIDPIRDGNNWYAYVNNNPINWIDLWGLSPNEPRLDNWPVTGQISDTWGPRDEPTPGTGTFHSGLDFAVPAGTPVFATGNGTVIHATNHENYGNMIVIRMDNGLTTAEMHLQSMSVGVGNIVAAGQQIGLSGNTGTFTTGPHLHFSVWGPEANIPNFTNGDLMITRDTIDPVTVLPKRP